MKILNDNIINQNNESLTPNDIYVQKGWDENGLQEWERSYKEDLVHGVCKEWYPNGQLKSIATYENGKLDGKRRCWYDNGQLRLSGFYRKGKVQGDYDSWHRNGEHNGHENFKEGKRGVGNIGGMTMVKCKQYLTTKMTSKREFKESGIATDDLGERKVIRRGKERVNNIGGLIMGNWMLKLITSATS